MKVLVVDDEEIISSLVAEVINNFGWEAKTCTNGKEALEHLATGEYSMVFLDLVMPEMGGVETLSEIQKRGIQVESIILSGNISQDSRDHCKKFGATKFLEKPVENSEIEEILKGENTPA